MRTDTIQTTKSVKVKRNYLTDKEIDKLIDAAKEGRYGKRDALMLLMSYRHGLRSVELVDLTWDQVDFERGTLTVYRRKQGVGSTQPLNGDELRALRALRRENDQAHVFVSERGTAMTTSNVRQLFKKLRSLVTIDGPIHAHALRHACGHKLADAGVDTRRIQDYLGHKNVQNTQRYTELSANKFKGFDKLI